MLPASSKIRLASWKNERGMMTIARRRFPRARGKEALVALSAVVAGIAGHHGHDDGWTLSASDPAAGIRERSRRRDAE
jgi:hypothetical protein